MKPLSISSVQNYLECGRKYELEKILRIRPVVQPSYFIFGSAVDKGLNELAAGKTVKEAWFECSVELDRLAAEPTQFMEMDYDGELLTPEQKEHLLKECNSLGYTGDDVDSLVSALIKKPHSELSDKQRTALALCVTMSLQAKAKLMLEAWNREVLPLITKVESVQQEIKWKDEHGNEFIGVLDLPAEVSGHGSLIADNKTASRPYDQDSVRNSPQLAIYSKVTGKKKAAFFVMEKLIRKNREKICSECGNNGTGKRHKTCDATAPDGLRCDGEWNETIKPEVKIQIIIDEVSEAEQKLTQEAMSSVAESIKKGCFPKNIKMCRQKFGQKEVKCPFYDYCRTGSMEGLAHKPEGER